MNYKKEFPILMEEGVHYLDSAATSQKPVFVLEALKRYYEKDNGNPGRGSHALSMASLQEVERCRVKVMNFIRATRSEEILFVKNTTEAINLVAYSYGMNFLKAGDEILLGISNHHANIVPWQIVAKKTGAKLRYIYLEESGQLDLKDYQSKLSSKTKLVSISVVVNVTGVIQPYREIIRLAKEQGALVFLDAAQSVLHFRHEAADWGVDFMAFSGHKIFAAMGVGVLYGKKELLEAMPPFITGGDMIEEVSEQETHYAQLPRKFEAGTKDVGSIVSLGAAIDFIEDIGYEAMRNHEQRLLQMAAERLKESNIAELYHHEGVQKAGVLAFNVRGVHSHDSAYLLDGEGVMVRSGHHCAQPLMKYLGIASCCRASFSIYNDEDDVEALVKGLMKVKEVFGV